MYYVGLQIDLNTNKQLHGIFPWFHYKYFNKWQLENVKECLKLAEIIEYILSY